MFRYVGMSLMFALLGTISIIVFKGDLFMLFALQAVGYAIGFGMGMNFDKHRNYTKSPGIKFPFFSRHTDLNYH